MQKDQRNLLASLALAGTVIAGIAGTVAVADSTGHAFAKVSPQTSATGGAFDKWRPTAAPTADCCIKFDLG